MENKGLKYNAWDEYEKSAKTLPKTGMKQFEPNNSWLENMQIEKGIMTRKNLIAVERVDRISQLASAEWLPAQKRAKVKKYSGQDWSNFGLEKNGTLYLIPEEALFLLEAVCYSYDKDVFREILFSCVYRTEKIKCYCFRIA